MCSILQPRRSRTRRSNRNLGQVHSRMCSVRINVQCLSRNPRNPQSPPHRSSPMRDLLSFLDHSPRWRTQKCCRLLRLLNLEAGDLPNCSKANQFRLNRRLRHRRHHSLVQALADLRSFLSRPRRRWIGPHRLRKHRLNRLPVALRNCSVAPLSSRHPETPAPHLMRERLDYSAEEPMHPPSLLCRQVRASTRGS